MAFSDLLADNLLLRWLTGNRRRYDLAVSMVGVKLGERLLLVGCADAGLLPALGAKVGYTGRTCGIDRDAGVAQRAGRVAERAGVLAEVEQAPWDRFPYADADFDVVVVQPAASPAPLAVAAAALGEVGRVLRPGGRCVIAVRARDGSLGKSLTSVLGDRQYRAARVLAEREGWIFAEAVKPGAQ